MPVSFGKFLSYFCYILNSPLNGKKNVTFIYSDNRKEQHILVMEDMLLEAYGKTWSERSDIKVELKKYKDMVLECCKDEKLVRPCFNLFHKKS